MNKFKGTITNDLKLEESLDVICKVVDGYPIDRPGGWKLRHPHKMVTIFSVKEKNN